MKFPTPCVQIANLAALVSSLSFLGTIKAGEPADNQFISFASRLTHGTAGTFDTAMPTTGAAGIEDRVSSTFIGLSLTQRRSTPRAIATSSSTESTP